MDFNEYQKKAHETAQYPTRIEMFAEKVGYTDNYASLQWVYPALGLAGEAGELLNKLKKLIRDKKGLIQKVSSYNDVYENPLSDAALVLELGDILWYISELSTILEISLDEVAQVNIDKLSNRQKNNTIKGSGDNR